MSDTLTELEAVAGHEAVLGLVTAFGGDTLYFPKGQLSDRHRIVAAVGPHAARLLVARFGGDTVYVPIARRLQARAMRAEGLSTAEIAARLKTTRRYVARMVKKTP